MIRTLALASLLAGCLADEALEPTGETEQALNGDSWATVDDNPYTAGVGALDNGVAISPLTHKILVAGARYETGGTSTWIVRGSPDGVSWFLNHSAKLSPTGNAVAYAVTADLKGVFYVVGTAVDASGVTHWMVVRSTNDGATWDTVLNQGGHVTADVPYGISVDDQQNVFVTGTVVAGSTHTARILRGTGAGSTWSQVLSYSSVGAENAFYGTCKGTFGTQGATYATGWETPSSADDGMLAMAFYTVDHGTTWTKTIEYGALHYTRGYNCAGAPAGRLLEAASTWQITPNVSSNWITTLWDVAAHAQLSADAAAGGSAIDNASYAVAHVAGPVAREYDAGGIRTSSGVLQWRTSFVEDAALGLSWTLSDLYSYPGSTEQARASSAAYDPIAGLYVVGVAFDATNRSHGIVRHRR